MNQTIIRILNDQNQLLWEIEIYREGDLYHTRETSKHSLFSSPLSTGTTPGKALDAFIVEAPKLISGL